jgi:hypothetical protein
MSRHLVSLLLAAAARQAIRTRARPRLRHQLLVNGDFALFGNTLTHDRAASAPPLVGTVDRCGTSVNDNGPDVYCRRTRRRRRHGEHGHRPGQRAVHGGLLDAGRRERPIRPRLLGGGGGGSGLRHRRQLVTPDGAAHGIAAEEGSSSVADAEGGPGALLVPVVRGRDHAAAGVRQPRGRYTLGGVDALPLINLNFPAFAAGG